MNQSQIKSKLKLLGQPMIGQVILDIIMLADSELSIEDTGTTEDYARAVKRLIEKQEGIYKTAIRISSLPGRRISEKLVLEIRMEEITKKSHNENRDI